MSRSTALFSFVFLLTVMGPVVGVSASSVPSPARPTAATHQDLTHTHFEQAIEQDLLERWRNRVSRVEVSVLAPGDAIRVTAGRLSLDVQPVPTVVRPGRILFLVIIRVDDLLVRKQRVAVMVKAFADLVLTSHGIPHGKILGPSDLEQGEWRVRVIEHGLVVSPEEAIGKQLLVTLPRGRPIPRPALQDPARDAGGPEQEPREEKAVRPPFEGQDRQLRHPPGSGGGFRVR